MLHLQSPPVSDGPCFWIALDAHAHAMHHLFRISDALAAGGTHLLCKLAQGSKRKNGATLRPKALSCHMSRPFQKPDLPICLLGGCHAKIMY